MLRFAAIGLDHGHIFDHVRGLLSAGAEFAGYEPQTTDPPLLEAFRRAYPSAPAVARERLLDDPSIQVICTAAVPSERASLAIEAMRRGKDVMVDKPGAITAAQLAALEQTVGETGRIFSICFSERFCVPSAGVATRLVADGAIGRVVQTSGLGPHRLNRAVRPPWFFDPARNGGILVDIASHQIDQFLHYTGSTTAEVVASTIGNFATPENPDFDDFGELLLRSEHAAGHIRVDWLTPEGLPTWGDGRMTILGTEGYIELRKYIDIEGRPGGDHLFLANKKGTRYMDCSRAPLDYFGKVAADVRERGETAMKQSHAFEVTRLAIRAQERAKRLTVAGAARSARP